MYGDGAYQSSDLSETNYADVAEAMGCHGIRVEAPVDLDAALNQALDLRGQTDGHRRRRHPGIPPRCSRALTAEPPNPPMVIVWLEETIGSVWSENTHANRISRISSVKKTPAFARTLWNSCQSRRSPFPYSAAVAAAPFNASPGSGYGQSWSMGTDLPLAV